MTDLPPLHIDVADADWIKRGIWDIPATNLPDLYEWLWRQDIAVDDFKKLDVYLANVERMPWLKNL
jgi:hypothetical protein